MGARLHFQDLRSLLKMPAEQLAFDPHPGRIQIFPRQLGLGQFSCRRQGRLAGFSEDDFTQQQRRPADVGIPDGFDQIAGVQIRFFRRHQPQPRSIFFQIKLGRIRVNNLPAHLHRAESRGLRVKQQEFARRSDHGIERISRRGNIHTDRGIAHHYPADADFARRRVPHRVKHAANSHIGF